MWRTISVLSVVLLWSASDALTQPSRLANDATAEPPSSPIFTIGSPYFVPSGPIGDRGDPYSFNVPVNVRPDHQLHVKAVIDAYPPRDVVESPLTQFSGQISGNYTFTWHCRSYQLGGNFRFSVYISIDGSNWRYQGGN